MKKILPYIFILTIVVQLFAPFSVGKERINKNIKAEASFDYEANVGWTVKEKNIELTITPNKEYEIRERGSGFVLTDISSLLFAVYLLDKDGNPVDGQEDQIIAIRDKDPVTKTFENLSNGEYQIKVEVYNSWVNYSFQFRKWLTFKTLSFLKIDGEKDIIGKNLITGIIVPQNTNQETSSSNTGSITARGTAKGVDDDFSCNLENFRGCIAEFFYLALFKPSAFLFGLTGKALDFTLQYSLDDDSYRSVFVVEGWGIVRDICNIFFIFILLYIAFKIILGIKGKADPKGLIVNVIIIGLLINFSLFATRIIIDASNILSRVFYNTEVINIGSEKSKTGTFGEIRLSEALITKVNPVEILANPEKIEQIKVIGDGQNLDTNPGIADTGKNLSNNLKITLGGFILICILSAAICLAGTVVFLNLALIFVLRVVMLWIAMIISPLAFFTYTDPDLAKLPKVGFRNWAKDTAKMAFTAPIFCFFMYIIISFLGSGFDLIKDVALGSEVGNFDFVIRIVVPFAFLLVLLTQAKKIAVSLAGEAGKAVSNFGGDIAGKAIGLATGGASLAMRGTIGAMGAGIAKNKKMTEWEDKGGFKGFIGRNVRNVGSSVGRMSFDARNTGWGQKAAKGLGIGESVQKPLASISKKGSGAIGNVELTLKGIEKRQENRDKLRPKTEEEKEKERQEKLAAELAVANAPKLKVAEEARDKAKQAYDDAQEDARLSPKNKALQKVARQKRDEYREKRNAVDAIKKGGDVNSGVKTLADGTKTYKDYATTNGNISKEIVEGIDKSLTKNEKNAERNRNEIARLQRIRDQKLTSKKDKESELNKNPDYTDKTNQVKIIENQIGVRQKEKQQIEVKIKQAKKSNDQNEVKRLSAKQNTVVYEINQLIDQKDNLKEQLKPLEGDLRKIEAGIKEIDEEIEGEEQITEGLEKEKEEITKDKETAEKAKLYAEQNGGLGESQKTYSNKIKKLKEEMEESGQTGDKKKFNEARKWESHNFFDWAQTGGLGVGFAKRREMAHGLYSAIGKQDKK